MTIEKAAQRSAPAHVGHEKSEHQHAPGEAAHQHEHGGLLGPNTEMYFALCCGALLGVGFGIEKLASGAPDWLPRACFMLAYVFGGFYTLREALDNLRLKRELRASLRYPTVREGLRG